MKPSLCVLVSLLSVVYCKNILGIFPSGAKSHFIIFDSLMQELARKGHNVVVVSPFKQKGSGPNYTGISVQSFKDTIESTLPFSVFNHIRIEFFIMAQYILLDTEKNGNILTSPHVQNLISKNITFDLIFIEMFTDDVFLLLAKKLNAPIIGFASSAPLPWSLTPFAAPQNPSYIPSFSSGCSSRMRFQNRLWNTLLFTVKNFFYVYMLCPKSIEVFEKHLGQSEWSLEDATKNISLFLINSHFSFHSARPYPPQVVEVGGIHLQPAKPVPQELDQWMNESTDGVIYFSFGSMLRGATLPPEKVKAFLKVFESLPQRILWKWEDDTIEKLPSNIKIMKWLPQRDILAHPKVKVFISHGGLLGSTEAVVSGIPILGIPMYGDQPNNVAALVENGVAVHIDYNNISVASLTYALNTLLNDKSYSENAKQLSRRFLDRPQSPLETAVYWTEYVIRHRGAPHLQSAAVHLTWYQYYLLDVAIVILATLITMLILIFYIFRFCLRLVCYAKPTKLKSN